MTFLILLGIALWLFVGYYSTAVGFTHSEERKEPVVPSLLIAGIICTLFGGVTFVFLLLETDSRGCYGKPQWSWPRKVLG